MTTRINQLRIAIALLFITACNTAPADSKNDEVTASNETAVFDLAMAKTTIERENARFMEAFKKGDSSTIASLYSGDGWMLPPNSEPVKGAGIVAAWGSFIRMGITDFRLTTDEVSGNKDQLAETGRYELYGAGNKLIDKGKYVVVWKPANGGWKLYRDIWNSSMPAVTAE